MTTSSLSELELDALTELVNIGVGVAATALREMVGEEILLTVPKVELLSRENAIKTLCETESSTLVAVRRYVSFAWNPSGPMSCHHSRNFGCQSSSARCRRRLPVRSTLFGIFEM